MFSFIFSFGPFGQNWIWCWRSQSNWWRKWRYSKESAGWNKHEYGGRLWYGLKFHLYLYLNTKLILIYCVFRCPRSAWRNNATKYFKRAKIIISGCCELYWPPGKSQAKSLSRWWQQRWQKQIKKAVFFAPIRFLSATCVNFFVTFSWMIIFYLYSKFDWKRLRKKRKNLFSLCDVFTIGDYYS